MPRRKASPIELRGGPRRLLGVLAAVGMLLALLPALANAADYPDPDDPRAELAAGFEDAATATAGMDLLAHFKKSDTPFFDPENVGSFAFANSDAGFTGDHYVQGNFNGFQIFDISDPANPTLRTSVVCPGGQGDVNVYGDLLFTSVEQSNGRVDCGTEGAGPSDVPNPDRMRGVRIWDISDLDNPVQVAAIQLCRGSHTHRLVEDPNDPSNVYIYNSGTAGQRHPGEAVHTPEGFVDGRCGQTDPDSPNPSMWMIEVIKVPVDNAAAAEVVNEVRLFQGENGEVDGLQNGPTRPTHPCADTDECAPAGTTYSPTPNTNTCHDITAFPEIGLAAGACQGNGLLIDISDPANPVRIDAVADENFAYWHSANFNNDGTTVMFTDEWGGGVGARCAPNHQLAWGANAVFTIDRSGPTPQLVFQDYYKLPTSQTNQENCVAHQANLVPVPGRDIVVQGWYQGGVSMFDMTDPANPVEIAYFDRGPISASELVLGGFWSAYWYNGQVYGSEIARGVDVFEVTPTDLLSENEIEAAKEVVLEEHNAMAMRAYTWDPSFAVAGAFVDQAERSGALTGDTLAEVREHLATAEELADGNARDRAVVAQLDNAIRKVGDADPAVTQALQELRATFLD
ncbi:LVIVD repeat-containing protein [Ornithinimicrobium cavernae]|uniref:LVIVD repeat-containing protein n=1 Tax=Ornithinimicrobium cavernae TaxID=2666047 RepID=UPI00192A2A4E|nr:hypothetical protein [Ornithinimicrobium cavernae]